MKLAGKVAMVTGGGSGLGAALCRAFSNEGMRVVAVDLDAQGARRVAAALDGLAVTADVTNEADINAALASARAWAGEVDVIVSNAGIGGPSGWLSDDAHWGREWNVHVMSNVYAARAVLQSHLRAGSRLASLSRPPLPSGSPTSPAQPHTSSRSMLNSP